MRVVGKGVVVVQAQERLKHMGDRLEEK